MEFDVHYVTDNQITDYSDDSVTIKDTTYTTNIILTNNSIIDIKHIQNIDQITVESLESVFALKPDLVIFGSGKSIRFPSGKVMQALYKNSIGVEVMSVQALCRTYNFLVSENRKIACIVLFD